MTAPALPRRHRQLLAAAVVVGLAARLAFAFGYWTGKPLTNDEQEYLLLAGSIAGGHGFRYPDTAASASVARYGRAPGYAVFLAPLVGTGPLPTSVPSAVKLAQCAVGALGVLVIGLFALEIAGPRAAVLAAALAAVYPPLVWLPGYALSEVLYSPLILGAAFLLAPLTDRPARSSGERVVVRALIAGAAIGVAALVRPSALVFLGLAAPWLAFRRTGAALALVLGTVLVVAPWTVRNVVEHRRLVLIASEGGITFWTGNHPLSSGEGDMAANPAIKLANRALRQQHPGATQEDLESIYYREAFHAIASNPLWWAGLLAKKFFYFWVPIGPSYTLHSLRHYGLTLASYGLLLPFGVAGCIQLARRRAQPWALWLLGSSAVLISVVFLATERYRIPVVDPVLIICASSWLAGRVAAREAAAPLALRT